MKKLTFFAVIFLLTASATAQKKVLIPSKDGITITADLYFVNDTLPYMLLCHQAGYSRGEYLETAKKFNKLGFNCLAIDLRSGKEVNGIINETAAEAEIKNKGTSYLDAEQDIITSLDYLYSVSKKKVVLVGSSYSASLALKIAAGSDKVKGVLAFSPGEYFGNKLSLKSSIKNLDVPVFVTCSREEGPATTQLMSGVKSKQLFIPGTKGEHGSKALWKSANPNYHEYWLAIFMFIRKVK